MVNTKKHAVILVNPDTNLFVYGILEDLHKLTDKQKSEVNNILSKKKLIDENFKEANKYLKDLNLKPIREVTEKDAIYFRDHNLPPVGSLLAHIPDFPQTPQVVVIKNESSIH